MVHIYELFHSPRSAREFVDKYKGQHPGKGAVLHIRCEGSFWAVIGHRFV